MKGGIIHMKKILTKIALVFAAAMISAVAFSAGNVNAAVKTMADGTKFDAVFYAATYPDVAAVLGKSEKVLYNHYKAYGKAEGRLPYAGAAADSSAFDAAYYAAKYPDVVKAMGSDPAMLKLHYDLAGKAEGRFANAQEEIQKTTAAATSTTTQPTTVAPSAGVTLASLPSNYAAISANVTLSGAGNGYMGKVVLHSENGLSAISFSIVYDLYGAKPYNGKSSFLVENVVSNLPGGQVYTRYGLAPLGQTVNLMIAFDTKSGYYYCYTNGTLIAQGANTALMGQRIYASVEAAGRDDNSTVLASFGDIRVKKVGSSGNNGDYVICNIISNNNPGLAIDVKGTGVYQRSQSCNVTVAGTIVGLGAFDWDSAFHLCQSMCMFACFDA